MSTHFKQTGHYSLLNEKRFLDALHGKKRGFRFLFFKGVITGPILKGPVIDPFRHSDISEKL